MLHPLVDQLRFTREKWLHGLEGISDTDARRRYEPMNCISWMIGHLAWHEQLYWLDQAQGRLVAPELNDLVATGKPASTPPLDEMMAVWHAVISASDDYLDGLTTEILLTHLERRGKGGYRFESIGTMVRRVTYHYWYHIGESQAVRQLLGHTDLLDYVGKIGSQALYRAEG